MTRKDFQVIAEILAYTKLCQDFGVDVAKAKEGVDYYLRKTNPNYNPNRFWQAVEKAYSENQALVA